MPLHASTPVGGSLSPDYFNPPSHNKPVLAVQAFHPASGFTTTNPQHFVRDYVGAPWVRTP